MYIDINKLNNVIFEYQCNIFRSDSSSKWFQKIVSRCLDAALIVFCPKFTQTQVSNDSPGFPEKPYGVSFNEFFVVNCSHTTRGVLTGIRSFQKRNILVSV